MSSSDVFSRGRRIIDKDGWWVLLLVRAIFYVLIFILFAILGKMIYEGIGVLTPEFIFGASDASLGSGGIGTALFGTFSVTLLMILMAVPLGVSAAIYLNEYAKETLLTKIIRISINNLAGVPSIVIGLFGMGFFVHFIGHGLDEILHTGQYFGQPVMFWASSTLAVLVLPTIITTSLDALQSVPRAHRLAAYGLGASTWQVIKNVVLPQARPGILTGTIFAVSRAIGETAPVLFLGVALFLPDLPVTNICLGDYCIPMINPMEQFMYLSYHIFVMATQSVNPSKTLNIQYGATVVLLFITISLNIVAIYFRYRFRKTVG